MNQRHALAYVFSVIIQRECDMFVDLWNSYKIRTQNNLELANGIPNNIFSFPEQCGGKQKSISVTNEFLQQVSTQSGLSVDKGSTVYDFLDEEFLKNLWTFFSQMLLKFPQMRQRKHIGSWNIN